MQKSALEIPLSAPKQKRVKILANWPKSYDTERATVIPVFSTIKAGESTARFPKVTNLEFLLCLA